MERKCVIFWHIRYLETYLLKNINPFGLGVQIFLKLVNKHEDLIKRGRKCSSNAQFLSFPR